MRKYWQAKLASLPAGTTPPPEELLECCEGHTVAWLDFMIQVGDDGIVSI